MNKRRVWVVCGVGCLIAAIVCVAVAIPWKQPTPETQSFAPTQPRETTSTAADTALPTSTTANEPYVSPIRFDQLQAINPDIYAWLEIPGTSISYPLVQSTDDSFYLTHDSDRNENADGALFTEAAYNHKQLTDPVTVIYGHNMLSGNMFGNLQEYYSDPAFLAEHDEIVLYAPDKELHFRIFAALPYSRMHLLYYYPFEKERVFTGFFDELYNTRALSATLIEERRPAVGDQVVVLSTCMAGDNRYRFLVMGVCKGDN